MGKIIAAESIAKETYPQPGDHERVAQEFMAVAETVPSLYAATVYGSTALKSARRRSDVDIAVAHTQEDITGFFTGLQNTFQALPYGNLIETHIISQEGLRDGEIHDGDIFLAEHLRLAAHESPIPGIRSQVFASM